MVTVITVVLVILGMTRLKAHWPEPSLGEICKSQPRFEDFGEKIESGKLVKVDVDSNTMAREEMKSELLSATGSAVNFAGKYILVNHECGDKCQKHAIIDPNTSKILVYGLQTTGGFIFKTDSRLIMTNPTGKNKQIYYEFKNGTIDYLCEN